MLSEHLMLCLQSAAPLKPVERGDPLPFGGESDGAFQSGFAKCAAEISPAPASVAVTSLGDAGGGRGDSSAHDLSLSRPGIELLRLLILFQ